MMTDRGPGKLATASVTVAATPERVWQALTDPALVKEYFFGTTVESDWTIGSSVTYSGEWEGEPYQDKGIVLEVDQPRLLVTSFFSPTSGLPDLPENYQQVTYEIRPAADGCTVSVTQDNNSSDEAADHSSANWQVILDGLAKVALR